jgi:hypothetical protein
MSVKLMPNGAHKRADAVGMIMAQLSIKAAIKKRRLEAEYMVTKEMKSSSIGMTHTSQSIGMG